jgi:hypothetical protein
MRDTAKRQPASISRVLLLCAGYGLSALAPLAVGIYRPGITGYGRAMLEDMVYGKAYKPFVKRQLVPLLIRGGVRAVPSAAKARLERMFGESEVIGRLKWPAAYATEFVLALGIMYASMIGFLVVLRYFLIAFLPVTAWGAHITAWLAGLALPVTFCGKVYIYDFTQLFLFTVVMILLYRRKWMWFYPAYILCCVNKETSVLTAAVFLLWEGRRVFEGRNLFHFGAMLLIGVVAAAVSSRVYQGNPGVDREWHLMRNLTVSISSLGWIRLGILASTICCCALGWRRASRFLKTGFLGTFPLLMIGAILWGYFDELRDYYEAMPFMVGLCAALLCKGYVMAEQRQEA